jgi:hypothetical protein
MLGHTDRPNRSPEIELSNPDSKQLTVLHYYALSEVTLLVSPFCLGVRVVIPVRTSKLIVSRVVVNGMKFFTRNAFF